jgi:hypothetical protein
MNSNKFIHLLCTTLLSAVLVLPSCNKENSPNSMASLNIVNALPTSAPLIVFQGSIAQTIGKFSGIGPLSYTTTAVLTPMGGSVAIYAIQKNIDTTSIGGQSPAYMLDNVFSLGASGLYSLFITGKDTTAPDYLFVQDILPVNSDSTAGIRFVNLSAGSGNVSVDIKGQPNGSEVTSLAYKGVTSFKSYAATSSISKYVFEFRDAVSGNLLASYTLSGVNINSSTTANTVLFRNLTIALIGQPVGGKVPQSCIRVNSF